MMTERFTKPLLFDRLAGPGVATVTLELEPYRQARKVMDAGYRLAIRERHKKCCELNVRDACDEPISLVTCGQLGQELHHAAEQLIGHAYGVLFDPLAWPAAY